MSIKVNIEISVSNEGYTEHEATILAALAAHPSQGTAAVVPAAEKPAPAPAKAVAEKPAPAKAPTTHAKPPAGEVKTTKAVAEPVAEPVAEEAPEPAEEDLLGGQEYTIKDAVAEATKLVSSGKSAKVKAALADLGAKKVSELSEDQIGTFMQALEA